MRLTKIYTKMGDKGKTMLADGSFVTKASTRIETYGTCDELNAHVGVLIEHIRCALKSEFLDQLDLKLTRIQNHLFDLGAELSTPNLDPETTRQRLVDADDIAELEREMDAWNEFLDPLKNFVLPGGSLLNAQTHVCRTVCRRAERICVRLMETEKVRSDAAIYLNRLSDWFFVCGRAISKKTDSPENLWQQKFGK